MKKILLKLNVLVLVFTLFSNLFAGNIFLPPGGKAMGMAGAFIAVADDATALYWNPAGLTQQEKSGAEFAAFYIDYPAKSNKSLGNSATPNGLTDFPLKSLYPTEPTEFDSKSFNTNAFLPFIGGYKRLNDTTVIGAGAYVAAGGGGTWASTVKATNGIDDLSGKIDAKYGIMLFNVSAGKTLTDKLSVGLGFNVAYMEDQEEYTKTYTNNPGGLGMADYSIKYDQKATGYGYEGVLGVFYKANDKINLGMTLKTGATLKLDGTANYQNNLLTPSAYSSTYTEDYQYPMTVGLGGAYSVTEKLRLSAQADYWDYSTMKKDIDYKTNPTFFPDKNRLTDWKDTIMCRIGAEYKYTDNLLLLGGWQLNPSPSPQDKLTLLTTDQYSYNNFCIGAQYCYNAYKFALTYIKSYSDNISQNGINYNYDSDTYRFNIGYKFA